MSPTSEPSASIGHPSGRPVLQLAFRYGVAVGVVCGLWMVGLHLTGSNAFGPKQLLAQLLVPLVAVASEWQLRRQLKPGKPGLGRSLGVGVLTAFVAALISASSLVLLAKAAGEPALALNRAEMVEIVRAQHRENQKNSGLGPQQLQQQLDRVQHLTVGDLASGNFTQVLVLGLILAVPAGIFLRE